MYLLYCCFCIVCFYLGKRIFYSLINPLSIYSGIWMVCLSIHQSGLIKYYEIINDTWLVLFITHFLFFLGCLLGKLLSKINNSKHGIKKKSSENQEKSIKKIIIILTTLSSISLISILMNIISNYGFDFLFRIAEIYADTLSQDRTINSSFDFKGLIYVAIVFSSIYVRKYGFQKFILFPIAVLILCQISNGSRGSLICGFLLFISMFIFKEKHTMQEYKDKKNSKVAVFLIILSVILITLSRSQSKVSLPYTSGFLQSLPFATTVYSVLSYLSIPIACLNEYIQTPFIGAWGASSFRVIYMIFDIDISYYATNERVYYTPIASNVITYIGELLIDFGSGAFIAVLIISIIFSLSFFKSKYKNSNIWNIIFASCFCIIGLSFFAFIFRLAILWYVLVIGIILDIIFVEYKFKLRG